MGKVQITINVDNGKGSFGCTMQHASLTELTLANAKLDIMKQKIVSQIEKAMNSQSNVQFENE